MWKSRVKDFFGKQSIGSWIALPFVIVLLLPLILPFLFVTILYETIVLINRYIILPIYYFAKYNDILMNVVYKIQYDERAINYQGSIEQHNDMDFQRQFPNPEPHPLDTRFEEIQRERGNQSHDKS